jgi:hypothetical protein
VYDTSYTMTNEYAYCGVGDSNGNVVFPTLVAGAVDTENSSVITGFTIATSNTGKARLTVNGELYYGDSSGPATYTPTLPTVSASKKASAMGFTLDTVSRLTASSWAFTTQTSYVQDSNGQRVCLDLYGGRIEASGDLVSCTGVPGAAADSGYTLSGPVASNGTNTGYTTGTVNVFKNVLQDT